MKKQKRNWRYDSSGERCLIISLPDEAEPHRILAQLAQFLHLHPVPGILDIVPAGRSLGLHYQPDVLWRLDPSLSPFQQLVHRLDALLSQFQPSDAIAGREVVIPVCYGGEYGPDLADIAQRCGMSEEEAIERHQAMVADVIMLGFLPGLPYLGGLDPQFSLPRRATPRMKVLKGAVGIANGMGVIYPLDSPGGWNLIGRTPLTLFDTQREQPCLLQAGDRIRFRAIGQDEFLALEKA